MQLIITMQTIELGLGYRVLYNNVAKMYSNSNNEKYYKSLLGGCGLYPLSSIFFS